MAKAIVPSTSAPLTMPPDQKAPKFGLKVATAWLQFFQRLAVLANAAISGVVVAVTGALDGDGTAASPLSVRVDGTTINKVGNNLHAIALPAGTFTVLTADPAAPANDTGWFFRDGATPETYYLRFRKAGVTKELPLGTPL